MKRRKFIALIGGAAVAWPATAPTQELARARLLGVLVPATQNEGQQLASVLRQQLDELGWSEGSRLRIEYRWTSFDPDHLQSDVRDLVRLNPDLMLVASTQVLSALLRARPTMAVVFVNVGNPVQRGFIHSLAKPGGNVTGLANADEEFAGKRLQLLKQIAPNLSRILVIGSRSNPAWIEQLSKVNSLVNTFELRITSFDADNNEELERAASSFAREADGGILVSPSIYTWFNREAITAIAARYKLPAVYPYRAFAISGGLMSYSFDGFEQWQRVATYIDRIFRGEKPGNLPVQQPTKFQLVINMKTATALGLTVPPTLLALAEEVIE